MNRDDARALAEDLYSKPRPLTPLETEQLVDFLLHLTADDDDDDDDSGGLEVPIIMLVNGIRLAIDEIDQSNYGIRRDPVRDAGVGLTEALTIEFAGWPLKVEIVK